MYEQWCIYDMMRPQTGKMGRKNGSNDWAVTCWTLNHCWSRCGAPHCYVYLISRIVFICLIKCCYSSKKETNWVFLKISFRLSSTKFLYLFKSQVIEGMNIYCTAFCFAFKHNNKTRIIHTLINKYINHNALGHGEPQILFF